MWRLAPSYSAENSIPGRTPARRRPRSPSLPRGLERVVIGEGEAREVLRPREVHHLRGAEGPVGAVRVTVEVVSGHRRERVRPSARSSIEAAGRVRGPARPAPGRSPRRCDIRRAPSRSRTRLAGSPERSRRRPHRRGEAPHHRPADEDRGRAEGDRLEDKSSPRTPPSTRTGCARRPRRPPRGARPEAPGRIKLPTAMVRHHDRADLCSTARVASSAVRIPFTRIGRPGACSRTNRR